MDPHIESLYRVAVAADDNWQAALDAAGINRFDRARSTGGILAPLFAAKLATYEAFRLAAFPHASR